MIAVGQTGKRKWIRPVAEIGVHVGSPCGHGPEGKVDNARTLMGDQQPQAEGGDNRAGTHAQQ